MATPELRREPVAVKTFFDAVEEAATPVGNHGRKTLTAAAAASLLADGNIHVPGVVQAFLGRFPEAAQAPLLDAVRAGVDVYRHEHGFDPDPTFIEHAVHSALQSARPLKDLNITGQGIRLDAATNSHHDQISLQPAVAMASIMAQFEEAIPYAAYLPANVQSNEARLAILSNLTNTDFGDYTANSSLDGIAGGGNYMDSERLVTLSTNGGGGSAITGQIAQRNGVVVGAGNAAMPLLRGRTVLLVNGLPVASEARNASGSGNSTIAGTATIAGTGYALSGTINTDTGAYSITSSPALRRARTCRCWPTSTTSVPAPA